MGLILRFIERFLLFKGATIRKEFTPQWENFAKWLHLFVCGVPLVLTLIILVWGNPYGGGLGNVGDTTSVFSREGSVQLLRKYTFFIPVTWIPFFFWIFKRSEKLDSRTILKGDFVYSLLLWVMSCLTFLFLMFIPMF
jgi:preprotein translocase subunit SecG